MLNESLKKELEYIIQIEAGLPPHLQPFGGLKKNRELYGRPPETQKIHPSEKEFGRLVKSYYKRGIASGVRPEYDSQGRDVWPSVGVQKIANRERLKAMIKHASVSPEEKKLLASKKKSKISVST